MWLGEEQNLHMSVPNFSSNGVSQAHPYPEYFAYYYWGRATTLRMKNGMQIRSLTIGVEHSRLGFDASFLCLAAVVVENMNLFSYSDSVVYSMFCTRKGIIKTLVSFWNEVFFRKYNSCIPPAGQEHT